MPPVDIELRALELEAQLEMELLRHELRQLENATRFYIVNKAVVSSDRVQHRISKVRAILESMRKLKTEN